MGRERALHLRGVTKHFGGTTALDKVDFAVAQGEIHALLGENGAGKSTLIKILAGLLELDAGTVEVMTEGTGSSGGIAVVHQELSLVPTLSVEENISLGRTPRTFGLVNRTALRARAVEAIRRVGLDVDPRRRVSTLSLAERQLVEIGRALTANASVLLLDEPTSSLNAAEADRLFDLLQELAASGSAVVLVSHRLDEVYSVCETATVLRDGRLVARVNLEDTAHDELIHMMVGQEISTDRTVPVPPESSVSLVVDNLRGRRFGPVSVETVRGEVVGVAGLLGAGQTEFLRALGGIAEVVDGSVAVGGRTVDTRTPRRAAEGGIAYVPADRLLEGLAMELSMERNAALPSLRRLTKRGLVDRSRSRALAMSVIEDLDVRPAQPDAAMSSLSGGNQQKVVVGKWLATAPPVLVLDDPTRGVDVGARAVVHKIIRASAAQGTTVLLGSTDLAELTDLPHRVLVFSGGEVAHEIHGDHLTEANLLARVAGAEVPA